MYLDKFSVFQMVFGGEKTDLADYNRFYCVQPKKKPFAAGIDNKNTHSGWRINYRKIYTHELCVDSEKSDRGSEWSNEEWNGEHLNQ